MPEKTADFADMYRQTIAYGLFAARCNHRGATAFRQLGAAAEIAKTNPFLRKLFETITGADLDEEPHAGFVDDLADLLHHADMVAVLEQFGKRPNAVHSQARRPPSRQTISSMFTAAELRTAAAISSYAGCSDSRPIRCKRLIAGWNSKALSRILTGNNA